MKVLYEQRGALGYVTLNRPEVHNCIDVEMSEQLIAVWEEIKRDRAFCSGADLKQLIPYLCRSEDWLAGQQAFLTRSKAVFRGK